MTDRTNLRSNTAIVKDKRQMLLHLDSDVIKDLKKAAVDRGSSASAIANEAIDIWLRQNELRGASPVANMRRAR
jgi:hypothetical protein